MGDMDDLVQFLRDRYDEEARKQEDPFVAWHARDCEAVPDVWGNEPGACTCGVPALVLAEVEAKRALVTEYEESAASLDTIPAPDMIDVGRLQGLETALQTLALPYAGRPDYKETWRP